MVQHFIVTETTILEVTDHIIKVRKVQSNTYVYF